MRVLRNDELPLATRSPWPAALAALAAYGGWLAIWYWETLASMVSIWYRSETFAHGFLVFPISAWLVWRQRHELAKQVPQRSRSLLPLLVLGAAGVLWLLGDLADVLAARHIALVTMVIAGTWWMLGEAVTRRIAFPLAFLYFAVPLGEFLLPTLIEWTANFTIAALRLSGVPVWRDGMTFQVPNGAWSVVEACSGLRYLIASLTVGVLYAYLSYRSLTRRVMFVIASILVPIVANWLRAYMIVMIGYLSGNKLAVGVDHIIYGWIFFGLVMLLLFWIGGKWREDLDEPAAEARAAAVPRAAHAAGRGFALAAVFLVAAAAPAAARLLHGNDVTGAVAASAPPLARWEPVAEPLVPWKPEFTPPRAAIDSTYVRGNERAGLYVAFYYDQDRDSKLVSSSNQLLRTTDKGGHVVSEQVRTIDVDGVPFDVVESVLRIQRGRVLARTWYWIDGRTYVSPARAKLAQAIAELRGHGDAGAIIVVYAVVPPDGPARSDTLDALTADAASRLPAVLADRLRTGAAK